MSSIFGIISKNGTTIESSQIYRVKDAIARESIDENGFYQDENVFFGHFKLIIHKRQELERQPFISDQYVICCDARIDNMTLLQAELNLIEYSLTDPIIILETFKKWGNDCVHHLNGEFVFSIWNKETKTLFIASDHIGFRTIYYYENNFIFAFSSEIKGIEAVKSEPLKLNEKVFIEYYKGLYHRITYDLNIHKLNPASFLLLESWGRLIKKKYWALRKTKEFNFENIIQWYQYADRLITNKIEILLDSNYPVGILLSGGLDSSYITSIACTLLKKEGKKLHAFSSEFYLLHIQVQKKTNDFTLKC